MKTASHTIKFFTLGCKVNQYDTQQIREQFAGSGFRELENGEPAEVYVINTCTVTRRADSDSLGYVRRAKRENPKSMIVVTGCLAELDSDKIKNIDKGVLIVKKSKLITPNSKLVTYFKGHTRAFLKIQDGCDNFCSYCKVPLVRGSSRSRPLKEIVEEAEALAQNGFKEIVLAGICLGSYGKDLALHSGLCAVIEALEKINGILRIRLSSIEAGDVSAELIRKIGNSAKLCRHLHVPIQSGDDEILEKMQRKYTRRDYLRLIRKLKKDVPGIAITTDCMVGFPGEREANFRNTLDLIEKIIPLKVHIFSYSTRKGTLAGKKTADMLPQSVIKERTQRLKRVADEYSSDFRKQFLKKRLDVLFEGRSKKDPRYWEGHSDNYIKVFAKTNLDLKNQLVSVKIKKVNKENDFCEAILYR